MEKKWIVLVLRRVENLDKSREMTYLPFGPFDSRDKAVEFIDSADFYKDEFYIHHKVLSLREV